MFKKGKPKPPIVKDKSSLGIGSMLGMGASKGNDKKSFPKKKSKPSSFGNKLSAYK